MVEAVQMARAQGCCVSALTIYSLWPVPEKAIRAALPGVERIVVAELNLGQYRREIERVVAGSAEVVGVHRVDGQLISPREILAEVIP
jgi:2-oxoglutarate ferredoxin oxidoreductase subunit alpha